MDRPAVAVLTGLKYLEAEEEAAHLRRQVRERKARMARRARMLRRRGWMICCRTLLTHLSGSVGSLKIMENSMMKMWDAANFTKLKSDFDFHFLHTCV